MCVAARCRGQRLLDVSRNCLLRVLNRRLLNPDIGDPKRILTIPGFKGPITGRERPAGCKLMVSTMVGRGREGETNTGATSVINGYKSRLAKRAREQGAILDGETTFLLHLRKCVGSLHTASLGA